jgi:hypothetical protein
MTSYLQKVKKWIQQNILLLDGQVNECGWEGSAEETECGGSDGTEHRGAEGGSVVLGVFVARFRMSESTRRCLMDVLL